MEYIFIHGKKEHDNRKERWIEECEKKEIKCKEMAFWRGSNNFFFIIKKHLTSKRILNKICVDL